MLFWARFWFLNLNGFQAISTGSIRFLHLFENKSLVNPSLALMGSIFPIGTESQFRRQQIIHNQFLYVNTKAKTMTMTKWWFHFPNGTESGLDAINYTQLFSARPPRDSFSDKNFGPAFSSAINISKSVKLFPLCNNVAWSSFLVVFLHFCPFYCRWVGRRQ